MHITLTTCHYIEWFLDLFPGTLLVTLHRVPPPSSDLSSTSQPTFSHTPANLYRHSHPLCYSVFFGQQWSPTGVYQSDKPQAGPVLGSEYPTSLETLAVCSVNDPTISCWVGELVPLSEYFTLQGRVYVKGGHASGILPNILTVFSTNYHYIYILDIKQSYQENT